MELKTLTSRQAQAVELLRNSEINTDEGTPEELFLLASSLIPVPNVDLLVINNKNQILLARRNDKFYEKNWHIPGGCMRFYESFEKRVQETAKKELHCEVEFDDSPLTVKNVVRGDNPGQLHPRERGHNVAILYNCRLPQNYEIDNGQLTEDDDGYLRWFDHIPEDFSVVQHVYDDLLKGRGLM